VLALLTFGHKEFVPLFPDTEGMGFHPAEIFNIPDAELVHSRRLNYHSPV
jgi:hypothetical protein